MTSGTSRDGRLRNPHGPFPSILRSPRLSKAESLSALALIWAVEPLLVNKANSTEEMLKIGEQRLLEVGVVEKGDVIVVMAGRLSGLGLSSSVSISTVGGDLGPTKQ